MGTAEIIDRGFNEQQNIYMLRGVFLFVPAITNQNEN